MTKPKAKRQYRFSAKFRQHHKLAKAFLAKQAKK